MRPQQGIMVGSLPLAPRRAQEGVDSRSRAVHGHLEGSSGLENASGPAAALGLAGGVLPARQFEAFLQRERDLADRGARRFSLLSVRMRASDLGGRAAVAGLGALAREVLVRVRSTDVVGRLGPGRLGILLPDTEPAGARVLARWTAGAAAQLGLSLEQAICVYPGEAEASGEPAPGACPVDAHATECVLGSDPPVLDCGPLFEVPTPACKRGLDILGSASALLLLLPLLGLIALAIRLDSPGPVIFRQLRAGRGGRPFVFYKFRSMRADAEAQRSALGGQNEQDGPIFKIRADPRITRLGRVLRRWSL